MSAEPIVRVVKRYVCPFCHRGWSKPARARRHIDRCWRNPAVRSCGSCEHFIPGSHDDEPGCEVAASVESADPAYVFVRDCPLWTRDLDAPAGEVQG